MLIWLFLATNTLWLSACEDGNEVQPDIPSEDKLSYDFSAVDQILQDSIQLFNENVVVLIQKDGQQIYSNTTGGLSPQDYIPVASASKIVSASVILSLADHGLLQLDDTIGTYLPVFTEHGKGHMTIRQCFTMTSGFEKCRSGSEGCPVSNENLTMEEAAKQIAETQDLAFEPGSTVFYGSLGMHVAGRAAEVASGKSWETLLQEFITDPCQMTSSDFRDDGLNPFIAGGLHSSAEDYIGFLQMILDDGKFNGKQVLSTAAIQEFFKPQTRDAERKNFPYPYPPPFYPYESNIMVNYGFGSWQDVVDPVTKEVEQISCPGALGAFPWIDRERNLVGIVFTNSLLDDTLITELKLVDLVRKAVDEAVEQAQEVS